MQIFLNTETLIIELLLIVSLVAIGVRRLRIPYTVALVVIGLLISLQTPFQVELTPELIMALFVPPLVFEAAFQIHFHDLQRGLLAILVFAIPGVILTTLVIGGALAAVTTLSLTVALLFGALIAATDPVAVVTLFRMLGVPKKLSTLIEGESLFNDGTAIVLFNLMLVVVLTGNFNLTQTFVTFVRVSIGGLAIGLALGWLISWLISHVDDYLIETTLTTVLAFGAYLIAERLHFSGVLAVVAAGLVCGNIGPQGMSPTTRIVLYNFWEYVAFLSSSLVFLLIGLDVDIPGLISNWQIVFLAILAVLVSRAIVVYGFSLIINRVSEPIPISWQHVLNWGGLRGAVSLALALSLPATLGADRTLLREMTFGVVLFTLLVQATTSGALIRRLKIISRPPAQVEYELRHARLTSWRAAESYLDRLHREGLVSTHNWEAIKSRVSQQTTSLTSAVRELLINEPELEAEEQDATWREMRRAQRSALLGLRRVGAISDEVFDQIAEEVDAALTDESTSLAERWQDTETPDEKESPS